MTQLLCALESYAACVTNAVEKGIIYGTSVYEKGEIKSKIELLLAYKFGLNV